VQHHLVQTLVSSGSRRSEGNTTRLLRIMLRFNLSYYWISRLTLLTLNYDCLEISRSASCSF